MVDALRNYRTIIRGFNMIIIKGIEMTTAEDKNLLAFLTWYEEITGEEFSEIDVTSDMWWYWKTWNKAISTINRDRVRENR